MISVLLVVVRYGSLPVSFLLFNDTVFCELGLMNVSKAIRQSRRLAFNLRNLRLFGTELKLAVGNRTGLNGVGCNLN